MTGHRTYNGEWLIVDGRSFDQATFRDCILVYHGGNLRLTNSTLEDCDLVGPWPLPEVVKRYPGFSGCAVHEPEVCLTMDRPAPWWRLPKLPRPTFWLWAYLSLCAALSWVVIKAMTL